MAKRESIPIDVKRHVLHLAGYKCANPVCRHILTLDIHHIEQVSEGGKNDRDNLIALCSNCHDLHHHTHTITKESIRAWHQLLLALNEAYPRHAVDSLLTLHKLDGLGCSGEAVLQCASLIASGMVDAQRFSMGKSDYLLKLTAKGRAFVEGWIVGDQSMALEGGATLTGGSEVSATATVTRPNA